jgi:esterase/lipase
VHCINPDWYKPLSSQVFSVNKNDVIVGFSFGAVLAYLITKEYSCKKVIFASISPIHAFSFRDLERDFRKDVAGKVGKKKAKTLGTELARDIVKIKISFKKLKTPYVTLVGQLEKGMSPADFIVPKTGHKMNTAYIKCIQNLI